MKSVVEIYLRSFVDLFLLSFCNTIRTFVVASFQVHTFILQRTFYLKNEPSQSDNFKKHLQQWFIELMSLGYLKAIHVTFSASKTFGALATISSTPKMMRHWRNLVSNWSEVFWCIRRTLWNVYSTPMCTLYTHKNNQLILLILRDSQSIFCE